MKAFKQPKDPSDEAWYSVDVAGVVGSATVADITCEMPTTTGVPTRIAETRDGTVYYIKLGGGAVGEYVLVLTIDTTDDQSFERSVKLKVKEG